MFSVSKTTAMTCFSLSRGSNFPLLPPLIIDAVRRTADTDQSGAWHRSRLPPRLSGHFLGVWGWAGAAALFDSSWSSFFNEIFFFPTSPLSRFKAPQGNHLRQEPRTMNRKERGHRQDSSSETEQDSGWNKRKWNHWETMGRRDKLQSQALLPLKCKY